MNLAFFTKAVFVLGLVVCNVEVKAADTTKGAEVYVKHCQECHGSLGEGSSVMLNIPNFSQNEALLKSDEILLQAIAEGKNTMPAYMGILNDSEIRDVIAFIRTLN